jgi:AcrR family transcriptional regulator
MDREIARDRAGFAQRPLTRRALSKLRTRERLVEAARELFMTRGYEASTIRDIAAAADLSTGAVFASFKDKADLFRAVLIADDRALFDRMSQLALDELTARDALPRLFRVAYERHMDQLGLVRAAMSFSWLGEYGGRKPYHAGPVTDLLKAIILRGVERGEFMPPRDVDLTTDMLWDCYLSNYRQAIFEGWSVAALLRRLTAQIDVLLRPSGVHDGGDIVD